MNKLRSRNGENESLCVENDLYLQFAIFVVVGNREILLLLDMFSAYFMSVNVTVSSKSRPIGKDPGMGIAVPLRNSIGIVNSDRKNVSNSYNGTLMHFTQDNCCNGMK